LVFCTAYGANPAHPSQGWNGRYLRWLNAILRCELQYEQVLLIDDGSPVLPDWVGLRVLTDLSGPQPAERVVMFHFLDNLGRPGVYDYPGWFRSFAFAARYAQTYGFEKIIHIESDAFLVSRRIQHYFNEISDGWVTFLGSRHNYPESGLQIIAGSGLRTYYETVARPYSDFIGKPIEVILPFTRIEHGFIGDRYGETLTYVPMEADWTMQAYMPTALSDDYYWWMRPKRPQEDDMMHRMEVGAGHRHSDVTYLDMVATMSTYLSCRAYLEIGTDAGNSLRCFRCDAVCIDPAFKIAQDIMGGRRKLHLFQMTSDDFFLHHDLKAYLPGGVDIAFLDGLHLFEVLLRDFINAERYCHERSIILLNCCLPLNSRMAERHFRIDETEDVSTRHAWTGDVWRLLPILRKYRPDLRVLALNCGPAGLIVCTNLDPWSRVLRDNAAAIVEEFSQVSLNDFGLHNLWSQYPLLDGRKLMQSPADLPQVLFGGQS
jgi:hypothetical protein